VFALLVLLALLVPASPSPSPLRVSAAPATGSPRRRHALFSCSGTYTNLTPCDSSVIKNINTNNTVTFTIHNSGSSADFYTVACTHSGALTGCGVGVPTVHVNAHSTATKSVTYNVGATPGIGTLTFKAMGDLGDNVSTWVSVTVPSPWVVSVTPDNGAKEVSAHTAGSQSFTVTNTGVLSTQYTFAPSCAWPLSNCSATPSSATLGVGRDTTVTVSFVTGAAGTSPRTALFATSVGTNPAAVDSGWVTVTSPNPVTVGPRGDTALVAASHGSVQRFELSNPGPTSAQYTLTPTCKWGSSSISCTTDPASAITIAPNQNGWVDVSYTAGATGTGRISLKATLSTDGTVSDSGWAIPEVATLTAGAPTVVVDTINTGPRSERALCLRMSVGGAEAECGDMVVVHDLPTVRTLNKARTPALIYMSQTAMPQTLIAANVTVGSGTLAPDSIKAKLILSGTRTVDSATWSGAAWRPGTTRRIELALRDTTANFVSYTVQITSIYNGSGSYSASATNEAVLINRQGSFFGAGWWVDGLEALQFHGADTLLWIGGDASSRLYTTTGTGTIFHAVALTRPDSIIKRDTLSSTYYIRYLPNGVRVLFNSVGQHVTTVNRLGHQTTFTYSASGDTLKSINVPHWWYATTYVFAYSAGRLSTVTVAVPGGPNRVVTLSMNKGRTTEFHDPDGAATTFGYPATGDTNLIVSRADTGSPTVVRYFTYSKARKLLQDSLPFGSTPIVTRYHFVESRGMHGAPDSAATPPDSLYTSVEGPRPISDLTKFFIDRYGETTRTIDALGDSTILKRTNGQFPALVTYARYPNGRAITGTYDTRGHLTASTDSGVVQGSSRATTQYRWNAKWDMVDTVISPLNEHSAFEHDASTGNLLWQDDPRGSISRVHFWYDATTLLVDSMRTAAATHSIKYRYDASLANLDTVTTAMGLTTGYVRDSVGRVTVTISPISSSLVDRDVQHFDLADRVLADTSSGPAMNGAPAESVFVRTYYDRAGNVDTVSHSVGPNPNGIAALLTSWTRDAAGRNLTQKQPDGAMDTYAYDADGHDTSWVTRDGDRISLVYDQLGRLVQRNVPAKAYPKVTFLNIGFPLAYYGQGITLPADSQSFTYDAVGNMLTANNHDALISRAYDPADRLVTDTLRIRTWDGSDFSKHVYGLTYGYDLDGRETSLAPPAALAKDPNGGQWGAQSYTYSPTGAIDSVNGHEFIYHHDAEDRVDSVGFADISTYETRNYDEDGRLIARLQRHSTAPAGTDTIHHETYAYDERNKATTVVTSQDSTDNGYSGLGTLVRSHREDCARVNEKCVYGTSSYLRESWTADALARIATVSSNSSGITYGVPGSNAYNSLSGRQSSSLAEGLGAVTDSVVYDAAGNAVLELQQASYPVRDGCSGALVARTTANFYTADQHLAVSDVRSNGSPLCVYTQALGTFEETRYDALGRRVLVRSRRDSSGVADGTITRFVWDGSQVSWEIHYPGGDAVHGDSLEVDTAWYAQVCQCGCSHPPQCGDDPDSLPKGYAPFYGRVWYLHVEGMDEPILVRRFMFGQDTVPFPTLGLYPMYNWRGVPDDGGLFSNSTVTFTYHNSTASILWPARNSSAYRRYVAPMEAPSWFGSLTSMSTTDAGTQYMRNRYYDPVSARFTQEDPLGIAGGLNTYGFGGGDPVTYSDPFGLCCFFPGVDLGPIIQQAVQKEHDEVLQQNYVAGLTAEQSFLQSIVALPLMFDGPGVSSGDQALSEDANAVEQTTDAIGIGPFAGNSIPARSAARDFTDAERSEIDEIGSATGCHTCGETTPGTKSGHFVPDHQPPTALNKAGNPQRLYPQCLSCSQKQGLAIASKIKKTPAKSTP
jgi:RHS repeat-associated protein